MSGKTLLIGGGVGVVGFIVGLYYRSQASDIADKAKKTKADIKTLENLVDQYEAEWHELQALYVTYMNGGTIDQAEVDIYKEVLASLESQIDVQCAIVQVEIIG